MVCHCMSSCLQMDVVAPSGDSITRAVTFGAVEGGTHHNDASGVHKVTSQPALGSPRLSGGSPAAAADEGRSKGGRSAFLGAPQQHSAPGGVAAVSLMSSSSPTAAAAASDAVRDMQASSGVRPIDALAAPGTARPPSLDLSAGLPGRAGVGFGGGTGAFGAPTTMLEPGSFSTWGHTNMSLAAAAARLPAIRAHEAGNAHQPALPPPPPPHLPHGTTQAAQQAAFLPRAQPRQDGSGAGSAQVSLAPAVKQEGSSFGGGGGAGLGRSGGGGGGSGGGGGGGVSGLPPTCPTTARAASPPVSPHHPHQHQQQQPAKAAAAIAGSAVTTAGLMARSRSIGKMQEVVAGAGVGVEGVAPRHASAGSARGGGLGGGGGGGTHRSVEGTLSQVG